MRLAWYSAKVRKPASYKSAKSHKIEYEENYHRPIIVLFIIFCFGSNKASSFRIWPGRGKMNTLVFRPASGDCHE